MEESASEAKTARPTAFPMVWWGAAAVGSGEPISQARQKPGGRSREVRRWTFVSESWSSVIIGMPS